ncbi:MAG: hypothetical protein Q4G46_13480, partial [Propionibacteriaceae bacterium]|nr:hypothetical protein [Propionibacteriaceae bacterium]
KLWPIAIHAVLHDESAAPSFANIAPVILYADHEDTAAQAFQIRGTPAAVILGVDGLVAGGPVVGGEAVVQLIDDVLAEKGALTS